MHIASILHNGERAVVTQTAAGLRGVYETDPAFSGNIDDVLRNGGSLVQLGQRLAEGTESYRVFIRALLSVTDNIVEGE